MSWQALTPMAKIEVIVDGEQVPAVRDLFLGAGATGYTALAGVSGFGHHGYHEGRLHFNDRASLAMLITVLPTEKVEPLVGGLRRLLEDHHGVVFVSETQVSRPHYFT
jgi:nitrogen regulatory protein PII